MKDFQDRYSSMFRDATRDAESCPAAESLADLASGRVWLWQRRRLVEHISHCSDCAADYRVLTAARSGLVTALEGQAHSGEGVSDGWRWSGLTAVAALVMVALSVSILIQTDVSAPATENRVLFASEFELGPSNGNHPSGHDRLFTSDFGEAEGKGGKLFRDDFGG